MASAASDLMALRPDNVPVAVGVPAAVADRAANSIHSGLTRGFRQPFSTQNSFTNHQGETMNTNITSLKTLKIMLLNLALTLILGSCVIAVAQPPWARGGGQGGPGQGGPGGPGGGNMEDRFARLLSLTDAQKTQIKNLREQAQTASKLYFEQIKPITEQMQKLIEAPVFDEAAARALASKMSQVQTEIHIIQAKTENAIYQLLTAEQKAKLAELRKAMEGQQGGRGGGRGGPFGRPSN
jgi:periplasmic protein CpxP/Spy